MPEIAGFLVYAVLIGVGATAFLDLWSAARRRLLRVPSFDYGLVGRWLLYMKRGRFRHDSISASPPLRGERPIGWIAHYLIGVAFAALLLAIWGLDWAREPAILPALTVGVATVAAPFLLMQPGMGLGIAASRTPNPGVARLRSLINHTVFGVGLYVSALALRLMNLS